MIVGEFFKLSTVHTFATRFTTLPEVINTMRLLPVDDEEKVSRLIGKSLTVERFAADVAAYSSTCMAVTQGVGYAIDEEGA
jgi:hypothetical protein